MVSIHTPTQGVTKLQEVHDYQSECFNPHTHAGCDVIKLNLSGRQIVSIHTPTQGVTMVWSGWSGRYGCFNPHTHAGCDYRSSTYCRDMIVSIHTPTQGVTVCISCCPYVGLVSIHTPTQGVTFFRLILYSSFKFQSTHPRRV